MIIDYSDYQNEIVRLRHHFHMHPETAFNEFETTAFIKDYLEKSGYTVYLTSPTGCTAYLDVNSRFPTVAVRAEMDAVPIEEKTGLPFSSVNSGAMHACGHDANMAVSLVLASLCAKTKEELSCNVRFIFEPAEEIGSGAEIMIKSGVLENTDAFIMFHFTNKDSGGLEVNRDIATAAIGRLEISLHGVSSHWANTAKSRNALMAASRLMLEIDNINNSFNSEHPFCIGIGKMSGGTSANIIADHAILNGNIRACTMEDYYCLCDLVEKMAERVSALTDVKIDVNIPPDPIVPIVNSPFMVKKAQKTGEKVFGDRFFITTKLYLAGDNACLYFKKVPGIFMVFRSESKDKTSLHNPKFTLNENELFKALEMLHRYLIDIYA